ncbi:alpha/beta hydrolase [Pseudothauera rhizosphaerae]|uniref:Alpha/beta hydrolase n=1 Tax=Pseudothauera rhizosphaerae TaxID=2565932 RepID=A0A4S4ACP7_9RHOO|nr:alpha/beta hydrolase [Pseudothauera rhizosphaerae]THF56841.1 alpha/beta hydrolase [Pseudothauera rhizosphaerae]
MYIVTNREVDETQHDVAKAFGAVPNPRGPNELRFAEAWREGKRWKVDILPDQPTPAMLAEVGIVPPVDPATGQPLPVYASSYVARKLHARINPKAAGGRGKGCNLLFFVHGYNNNVQAVLDRAEQLQANYGVEVLPFSWPANGGGAKGVVSYKSDKRDALASTGALDRCLARLEEILLGIHAEHVRQVEAEANRRFPDDAERWDRFFSAQAHKRCPFTVNMMLHSMGNYVFKHLLKSSVYRGDHLVFDNVVLVAADTNNEAHAGWVDRIQCRGRVYVTLNERDAALQASRMKLGEQQKARLGHYPHYLDSRQAVYVDFTEQPWVGDSHAYFEDKPLKNPRVKAFFHAALNGTFAETGLPFDIARNMYRIG